jgi:hypothetical protein
MKLIAIFVVVFLGAVHPIAAQEVVPPHGPRWCANAARHLTFLSGSPFSCATANPRNLRCVRMNNYGCLQQPRRAIYYGTTWGGHSRGARDNAGHAIFDSPVNSVVGIMNVYLKYKESGMSSALAIATRYSPWCDTLGSIARKQDRSGRWWYKSCGVSRPPGGALTCHRPMNGLPVAGQCQACNCPPDVARRMLSGTGISSLDQPLPLFDEANRPHPLLVRVIKNKMIQELGYRPTSHLLEEAIIHYRPQRW